MNQSINHQSIINQSNVLIRIFLGRAAGGPCNQPSVTSIRLLLASTLLFYKYPLSNIQYPIPNTNSIASETHYRPLYFCLEMLVLRGASPSFVQSESLVQIFRRFLFITDGCTELTSAFIGEGFLH
jgi:hypothetical protein